MSNRMWFVLLLILIGGLSLSGLVLASGFSNQMAAAGYEAHATELEASSKLATSNAELMRGTAEILGSGGPFLVGISAVINSAGIMWLLMAVGLGLLRIEWAVGRALDVWSELKRVTFKAEGQHAYIAAGSTTKNGLVAGRVSRSRPGVSIPNDRSNLDLQSARPEAPAEKREPVIIAQPVGDQSVANRRSDRIRQRRRNSGQ